MVFKLGRFFALSTTATRIPISGPSTDMSANNPEVCIAAGRSTPVGEEVVVDAAMFAFGEYHVDGVGPVVLQWETVYFPWRMGRAWRMLVGR